MSKLGDEPAYPAKQFSCPECKGYGSKSGKFCPKCNGCGLVINDRYHGFSKRERACIDLRIPESNWTWLDELIEEAQRRDVAAAAMRGIVGNASLAIKKGDKKIYPAIIFDCVQLADLLLALLGKENDDE